MKKKKVLPGEPGHLDYAKKIEMLKVIVSLVLVLIIFFTGLIIIGSRKNWFTLIAVLGCLPLARYAVNWIVRLRYHSISKDRSKIFLDIAGVMPVLFDFVFTTKDKNYAVECIAISDNTICGLTLNEKTDPIKAGEYLTKSLKDEGFANVTVKIFKEEKAFVNRLNEMAEHYNCSDDKQSSKEERIARSLFAISL